MNVADKSSHEERSLDSLNILLCALTGRGSLRDDTVKQNDKIKNEERSLVAKKTASLTRDDNRC
jgi:hypothetical protein